MRARNIKPGFFKNGDLIECTPLARILFVGLWCYSDREGRFKWNPKTIKHEVLPGDECDVDELLGELEKGEFIVKYKTVSGIYGQCINFSKHQNPHVKEKESSIPEPDKHQTNTRQTPDLSDINPSDSLIPDPLIPDSKEVAPLADHQKRKNPFQHLSLPEYEAFINNANNSLKFWYGFFGKAEKDFKQKIPFALIDKVMRRSVSMKGKSEKFDPWPYLRQMLNGELPMANEDENVRRAAAKAKEMERI